MNFDEVSNCCDAIRVRENPSAAARIRAAAAEAKRFWTYERYPEASIETARRAAAEVALVVEGCLHFLHRAPSVMPAIPGGFGRPQRDAPLFGALAPREVA